MKSKRVTLKQFRNFLVKVQNDDSMPEKLLVGTWCNKNNKVDPIGLFLHEKMRYSYEDIRNESFHIVDFEFDFSSMFHDYDGMTKMPYLLPREKAIKRMLKVIDSFKNDWS